MSREYVIAAFRSPDEAVRAVNFFKGKGLRASLINTPSSARTGCGISLKTDAGNQPVMKSLLGGFSTLAGVFRVVEVKGSAVVTRV